LDIGARSEIDLIGRGGGGGGGWGFDERDFEKGEWVEEELDFFDEEGGTDVFPSRRYDISVWE